MTRRRRQLLNSAEDLRPPRDLDNIAHFEPRRETVGDLLRRAREGKGQALDFVATRLRIRSLYLKAIEEGRFHDLPGLTYAVGFVRTYADHLGLDDEDVVRRFRDEVAELKSQTQLIFPMVAAEGKIPRGAILLLSAVLAAIAYGGWYYLSEREQSALDLIPELPAKLRALVAGETPMAPDAVPQTPPAVTAETAPAPVAGDAAPAETAPPETAPAPAETASAETAPAETAAAPETAAATTDIDTAAPVPDDSLIAAAPAPEPVVEPAPPAAPVPAPVAASDPIAESTATAPALPSPDSDAVTQVPAAQDPAAVGAAPLSPTPPATGTTLPAPAVTAPAAPNLDASGLPTVAAPAAPTTGNLAGLAPATDAPGLPAITDGQAFGVTDGPSRIVLIARLESWVQVTDPETNALLTRVLRAGDRFYVPDQPGLSLATGNAGGIDIWVDGSKAPPLGPVGVVRRGVTLDPQRLVDGTALGE